MGHLSMSIAFTAGGLRHAHRTGAHEGGRPRRRPQTPLPLRDVRLRARRRARRRTGGVLAMGRSTLYPLLYNLEAKELIKGVWRTSESGRDRKYYALTGKLTFTFVFFRLAVWTAIEFFRATETQAMITWAIGFLVCTQSLSITPATSPSAPISTPKRGTRSRQMSQRHSAPRRGADEYWRCATR